MVLILKKDFAQNYNLQSLTKNYKLINSKIYIIIPLLYDIISNYRPLNTEIRIQKWKKF